MWVRALGERTEGRAGLILIETLRTMTLSTMAELSGREEPVSTAELARLALVLKRIEGTDKLRLAREQAAAKAAAEAAAKARARRRARHRPGRASRRRPSTSSTRPWWGFAFGLGPRSHRRRSTRGILRNPANPT